METLRHYLSKMRGTTKSPPGVSLSEILWSWTGAFLGIGVVAWIHYNLFNNGDILFITGSFGASAVLLYGVVRSPLAQPRNLLGGHIISALIGVTAQKFFHDQMWLASALAVATSLAVMHATRTLHPPGGATALIAVTGSDKIHDLGYWYTIVPVGTGAAIMLVIALLVNNIPAKRKYPEFWL